MVMRPRPLHPYGDMSVVTGVASHSARAWSEQVPEAALGLGVLLSRDDSGWTI